MELLIKFIAANNKEDIKNNLEYINNIYNKLCSEGLIKNIMLAPHEMKYNTTPVKEFGEEDNKFLLEFCSEQKGKTDDWYITFEFGTYNETKQLEIVICSNNYIIDKDNIFLEKLKLNIKNFIVRDWENLIWLIDKDSECLSINLYSKVYKTENLMREFINEVMIKKYGTSWWSLFAPYKIKDKHSNRRDEYKSKVPAFNNIDERLMSIDIDELGDLIRVKRYKWNPKFDEKISAVLNGVQKYNDKLVHDLLDAQRTVDVDLWSDIFSNYLSVDFYEKFSKFAKDRNHIMHNKLLDRDAYKIILNLSDEIEESLSNAIKKFNMEIISKEEKIELERQQREEFEMLEMLEHDCKENDANVSIKSYYSIKELFEESIIEYLNGIEENLRFRDDIEISKKDESLVENSGELMQIRSKIDDLILSFNYDMAIIDDEGADSELSINCSIEDGDFQSVVIYTNGAVEYDDESCLYMPVTEDSLWGLDEAIDKTVEFVENNIKNYKECAGTNDISENLFCSDCGMDSVCINDDLLPIGTCISCGYVNSINLCERCEGFFNSDEEGEYYEDEEIYICQDCIDRLENE